MLINVKSSAKRQVIDITKEIEQGLKGSGVVNLFVKHTTAALTVADLDPGTDQDILDAISQMMPAGPWRHPHDPSHFPDHLWSSLIGVSLTLPFKNGFNWVAGKELS